MFELADRLVGIYKTNDATKSVTINPKMFEAAASGVGATKVISDSATEDSTVPIKMRSSSAQQPLGDVTNFVVAHWILQFSQGAL